MQLNAKPRGYLFNEEQIDTPNYSNFDLSNVKAGTMNEGQLVPMFIDEVAPGDMFEQEINVFGRTAPMLAPIYGEYDVKLYTFFVTGRSLQTNFKKVVDPFDGQVTMSQQTSEAENLTSSFHFSEPAGGNKKLRVTTNAWKVLDFFGIKLDVHKDDNGYYSYLPNYHHNFSLLPFLAYIKIWDNWFRDQNLTPITISDDIYPEVENVQLVFTPTTQYTDDIEFNDVVCSYEPIKNYLVRLFRDGFSAFPKAWSKDYFTSALPSPQRGPSVTLPLGNSAPLKFRPNGEKESTGMVYANAQGTVYQNNQLYMTAPQSGGTRNAYFNGSTISSSSEASGKVMLDITKYTNVDLSEATGATINTLRAEFALQGFFETLARVGSRYSEFLKGIFNVELSDLPIIPDLVATSKTPIMIDSNTSESASQIGDEVVNQGTQTGNGMMNGNHYFAPYECKEHGYLITLACITRKAMYTSGINRMFWRRRYLDFMLPQFAQLGEQEVFTDELSTDNLHTDNERTLFGWQSRYSDYKYKSDEVFGEFRHSLSYWVPSRKFENQPMLNQSFISVEANNDHFAVLDDDVADHYYLQLHSHMIVRRALPLYNTPALL